MDPTQTQLVLTMTYDLSIDPLTGLLTLSPAGATVALQPKPPATATAAAKRKPPPPN